MRLPTLAAALTLTTALGASLGTALPGTAAAQTPAAAPQATPQGPVTLLTYSGIFRDNYLDTVVNPFAQRTGIAVQYGDAGLGGSAQFLGTLRAQKADPQVDVVIMDATTAAAACAEGLVEKLTPEELPELNALDEQARTSGAGCGPAVTYDHLSLVYDTQKVKPAPTRWADFSKPEFAGKESFTTLPNIQALALIGALANHATGDWRKIDAALPTLKAIAPNVQTFEPSPDGGAMVLSGQVEMGTLWNARAQYYHDQSKGRLGVIIPEEGTAFQINTINIVANAPHRAAALAFVRNALSTGPQVAFTDRMFYGPTNVEAQRTAKAIDRTALDPKYRSRVAPIDWLEAVRLRDRWNQIWRREVMAAANR